jgi:Cys-Gly metallodipeptidase DUG1
VDQAAGANIVISDDKVRVLMGRMREPSLSIHGIEGAFSGPGAKTVIVSDIAINRSVKLMCHIDI